MKKPVLNMLLASILSSYSLAFASDIGDQIQSECGSCHALSDPGYEKLPIEERITRKAPPLYYAGNKFRRDWLVQWIQEPVQIRPAGYFPPDHTISTAEGDIVDGDSLSPHPKVNAQNAEKIADYLMNLHPYDSIIQSIDYQPGDISIRMGQLTFDKFNGCIACHQDEPGYGGVSGPQLYSAWTRLQPEFIASFILSPEKWDPHTLMPNKELNLKVVSKLTDYLKVITEE